MSGVRELVNEYATVAVILESYLLETRRKKIRVDREDLQRAVSACKAGVAFFKRVRTTAEPGGHAAVANNWAQRARKLEGELAVMQERLRKAKAKKAEPKAKTKRPRG